MDMWAIRIFLYQVVGTKGLDPIGKMNWEKKVTPNPVTFFYVLK